MRQDFTTSPWGAVTSGLITTLAVVAAVRFVIAPDDPALTYAAVGTGLAVSLLAAAPAVFSSRRSVEMEEAVLQSEQQAMTDSLTGLPNRSGLLRYLDHSVKEARATGTVVGVLFLDLDRFKVINDNLGHEAGDKLLCEVANRIREVIRSSDVVARFGGDEFVVITRGLLNPSSTATIAGQILDAFVEPIPLLNGGEHVVTPSIGISTTDDDNPRSSEELVRDADAAMYRAKRDRSGYALFDEEQRKHALGRLDVEAALRVALEDSNLEVFYQPIVDAEHRSLDALEALVRWDRPGLGIVAPKDFLDVAEEAGLISPIGELVLREACAQCSLWQHDVTPGVKIGVNIAERQLLDSSFVSHVDRILEWSHLPPHLLTLEITEDIAIDQLDSSLSVLRDLKALGVGLAIDDFGTGRSSLSYIRRLDMVDVLKIDKSFVDNIGEDGVDLAIVESIVRLARAVGLAVVAEGVETETQFGRLQDLGVERMQGFLFARPLIAADLERSIREGVGPVPGDLTVPAAPRRDVAPVVFDRHDMSPRPESLMSALSRGAGTTLGDRRAVKAPAPLPAPDALDDETLPEQSPRRADLDAPIPAPPPQPDR